MRVSLNNDEWLEVQESGKGPMLVLLHAFPLSSVMWRAQRRALADHWHIVTPDLRGFGDSSGPLGTPSMGQWAGDLDVLLDQISPSEPVVLGGLSMGGYVALAFLRSRPERVRALILADTRADADSAEAQANRDKTSELARNNPPAHIIETMLPRLLGARTHAERPEVVAEVRRIGAAQSSAGIIAALQALRDRPDSTDLLSQIKVPTLILVGSDDVLTPPSLAEAMHQGIAGSLLTTIDGAGHLSNLEQPEAFNSAVLSFLDGLPPL